MMKTFAHTVLLLAAVFPLAAQTPAFDSTGNGLLQGTYYFREVIYVVGNNSGALGEALSLYGNIAFDGAGNYSITNASVFDAAAGRAQAFTTTGKYNLAASGYGYMSTPASSKDLTYILVSKKILIGSATETAGGFNEMIVAAPLASPAPTVSSFTGSYTMTGFIPASTPANTASVTFPLSADGAGNLGTVGVTGYFGGGGSKSYAQNYPAVKYFFSNGAAVVTFPTSANALFFSGQEYLYFSADGNFVFGGAPNGFDMLIGIRPAPSGSQPKLSGLYYQAGIDLDASTLAQGFASTDTYYGSFSAGQGSIVAADRLLSVFNASTYTSTYSDTYPATISSGNYANSGGTLYSVSADGSIRIGAGTWPSLGLNVALQAPVLTAPDAGPFIFANGIANAGSASPFTAGLAGGELITIYGARLAASTVVTQAAPFPNRLGGVQVMINGVPAAIYYVSAGQISAIVPSGLTVPVAQIQIINNGVPSNIVTQFVRSSAPGIFTQTANGLGYAAAVHNDTGAVVTALNPAQPGEYLQVFLTGLGAVFPVTPDGAPGPVNPLSTTTNKFTVFFGDIPGTQVFSGLAPTLAGLYQMNIQVPASLTTPGDYTLEIDGPDAYTAQASIPVGNGVTNLGTPPTEEATPAARRLAPLSRGSAPQRRAASVRE